LDNLAQVRSEYPQEWVQLLDSAGLDRYEWFKMSEKNLLDCCEAVSTDKN
jgi:hypothetical protein